MPKKQSSLEILKTAIRDHIAEMDKIMNGPVSFERGQQIAGAINRLAETLREQEAP